MTQDPKVTGTDWVLVFTNKGTHFFYNKTTKESHWRVEDAELNNSMEEIEKDNLLLLIAKSRGLKLDDDVEEKLQHELKPKEEFVEEPGQDDNDLIKSLVGDREESADQAVIKSTTPLVSGYSSSDDDSDDEVEEENGDEGEKGQQINVDPKDGSIENDINQIEHITDDEETQLKDGESSEEENAFDLADLEGLSSDEEEKASAQESELRFLQLLQESSLNPYSPWELERIYDQWASAAVQQREINALAQETAEEAEAEEEPLVEYIKFLETKELERLYVDFKKKWKKQLKKLKLGDKDKEKIYKEYIIYNKKSEDEKAGIFKSFLMGAKIFKKNVQEASDLSILQQFDDNKVKDLDSSSAYKVLHQLEKQLNVSDSLKDNTKYYIVEIRKRISLLVEVAKLYTN
ncbi:unnamed protein product [Wickerhamomyces anomalus]